jgi:hypothetical protein
VSFEGLIEVAGGFTFEHQDVSTHSIPREAKYDRSGKYGLDARMIEIMGRELAPERFLEDSDDQRAEREVCRTAVLVAHRDSLRNKIVLPVERISKPRSQKLFDFSIAQDAKNDLRTSRSTGVVIRMRRCSRTGGRRLIRWKKSKSGGNRKEERGE